MFKPSSEKINSAKEQKMAPIKKIDRSSLKSIKLMENFLKIQPKDSLFDGKSKVLNKALLFSERKKFQKKEDGELWKIFEKDGFMYYCITYHDYYVRDLITGKDIASADLEENWLKNIFVEPEYRRKGIGTNLIRAIVKTIKDGFLIPGRGLPQNSAYYLSTEGAALITHCIKKGIINEIQCLKDVPPPTPSRSNRTNNSSLS